MQYVAIAVIGLVVGLLVGRFLAGNNFSIKGDVVFALIGAFAFAVGLSASGLAPESGGTGGSAVMAGIGALAALLLRRAMRSV